MAYTVHGGEGQTERLGNLVIGGGSVAAQESQHLRAARLGPRVGHAAPAGAGLPRERHLPARRGRVTLTDGTRANGSQAEFGE
ncbi:MAG: hypothetical protein ABJA98_12495 [Acidobacteriota bacterium]